MAQDLSPLSAFPPEERLAESPLSYPFPTVVVRILEGTSWGCPRPLCHGSGLCSTEQYLRARFGDDAQDAATVGVVPQLFGWATVRHQSQTDV